MPAIQDVVPGAAIDDIVAEASTNPVVVRFAVKLVIAVPAIDNVIAAGTKDNVCVDVTPEDVIAEAAQNNNAVQAVNITGEVDNVAAAARLEYLDIVKNLHADIIRDRKIVAEIREQHDIQPVHAVIGRVVDIHFSVDDFDDLAAISVDQCRCKLPQRSLKQKYVIAVRCHCFMPPQFIFLFFEVGQPHLRQTSHGMTPHHSIMVTLYY